MDSSTPPVIVGINGSRDARCAMEWAVTEAAAQLTSLSLVHVTPSIVAGDDAARQQYSSEALRHAQNLIRRGRLAVPVTTRTQRGDPAEVLVGESFRAALICVGAGGSGAGHPVGPVAAALAERAGCSVAIIRPEAERTDFEGVVAVVLDDGRRNDEVVHRAMQEGRRRGLTVRHIDRRRNSWVRRYPDVAVELVAMGSRLSRDSVARGLPTRLAVVDSADAEAVTGTRDSARLGISGFPNHCSTLVVRDGGR